MSDTVDHIQQRYSKLEQIEQLGFEPYPHKFEIPDKIADLVEKHAKSSGEELEHAEIKVQTAGRLVSLRIHGKAGFGHLSGSGHRIQIYVRQDRVGEKTYDLYRLLDVGDFVGVTGNLARTRTGELTVFADELVFLAKALQPLPEKWHGLSDVEIRYRQRYLDLIANQQIREIFVKRSKLISELRRFMEKEGYLEVETPMMQAIPGGATAKPFKTFHEALGIPLYLRIAPELYLKRLVVGGFDRVFEINRNFRNEGISTQHNPEFTMLEFYQAYSDYNDLMDLTEKMLTVVVMAVAGDTQVEFRGNVIDFGRYSRYSLVESVRHFWEGDKVPGSEELENPDSLKSLLGSMKINFRKDDSWGKLLGTLFEAVVEPKLIQPTLIYDFPVDLSPLSKRKDSNPRFVERFELFAGGLELANAYSELNDPEEQHRRFEQQLKERARGDQEAHEMDEDYVKALRYGMPPTAGEGIGIDRLTMILTNSNSIREVILFPHLRPTTSDQ
jgi:lysyl-tRNA synthetase class 2